MFYLICLLSPLFSIYVDSTYLDQSQAGDFNVQVDVKDVQIFGLMKGDTEEDYMEYDYTYDYSQLTIKPQNRTTPRPLNVTGTSTELNNLTTPLPVHEHTMGHINSDATTSESISTTINSIEGDNTTVKNTEIDVQKKTVTTTQRPAVKCKKGFVVNKKGECQLQINNTGNALLKLVKLSQRLKLRRENKSTDNS